MLLVAWEWLLKLGQIIMKQERSIFFEAGAGLGVAYYFTKNIGIFGEAFGGRFYNSWYSWRAGLSILF